MGLRTIFRSLIGNWISCPENRKYLKGGKCSVLDKKEGEYDEA